MTGMFLSDRDLRAMLRLTRRYDEVEADEVMPAELCQDLVDLVRCDDLSLSGQDSVLRSEFAHPEYGDMGDHVAPEGDLFWHHYYDHLQCTYPDRTGDISSVIKTSDFYSLRRWHSHGMYVDRAAGGTQCDHVMMLCLPEGPAPTRLMRVLSSGKPVRTSPNATGQFSLCCDRTCMRPTRWRSNPVAGQYR